MKTGNYIVRYETNAGMMLQEPKFRERKIHKFCRNTDRGGYYQYECGVGVAENTDKSTSKKVTCKHCLAAIERRKKKSKKRG